MTLSDLVTWGTQYPYIAIPAVAAVVGFVIWRGIG